MGLLLNFLLCFIDLMCLSLHQYYTILIIVAIELPSYQVEYFFYYILCQYCFFFFNFLGLVPFHIYFRKKLIRAAILSLFPIIVEKTLSFIKYNLAVGVLQMFFIKLSYLLSIPNSLNIVLFFFLNYKLVLDVFAYFSASIDTVI